MASTGVAGLSAAAFLGGSSSSGSGHPPPSYYAPSSTAAVAAAAPPPAEEKHDLIFGAKQFRAKTDEIVGFSAVKPEDREAVTKLIAFVTAIKCQSDDISGANYDRPNWTRVEVSEDADYTIVLGGWESLGMSEFMALRHYDPKIGLYRNLIDFEVRPVKDNRGMTEKKVGLILRYQGEELRRRRIATERDETPMDDADSGGASTHARKRTRPTDDDDAEPGLFTRALKFLTSVD